MLSPGAHVRCRVSLVIDSSKYVVLPFGHLLDKNLYRSPLSPPPRSGHFLGGPVSRSKQKAEAKAKAKAAKDAEDKGKKGKAAAGDDEELAPAL